MTSEASPNDPRLEQDLELGPELYAELRRLACTAMAGERPHHTLQVTALVNEAWMRLSADRRDLLSERGRYLAAAAETMRRILVDHARRRARLKRGGGTVPNSLDERFVGERTGDGLEDLVRGEELLRLDEALEALEKEDARKAMVVEARYFLGLELEAVAAGMGVSLSTVKRDWSFARAWLQRRLEEGR